jgi:hypothetical protein
MSILNILLDKYDRKARLYPMFIVLSPVAIGISLWLPFDVKILSASVGLAISLGMSMFLSQIARDKGKEKERMLFEKWGGKPSTTILSYKLSPLSHPTLSRYHRKLKEMDSSLWFPTSKEEEIENEKRAFASYESSGDLLRAKTRDKTQYALLFLENINYGYRRNLWGIKPIGIGTSILGLIITLIYILFFWFQTHTVEVLQIILLCYPALLLLVWGFRINPNWVKLTADAYAERLISTCDNL